MLKQLNAITDRHSRSCRRRLLDAEGHSVWIPLGGLNMWMESRMVSTGHFSNASVEFEIVTLTLAKQNVFGRTNRWTWVPRRPDG